jgi:hypothetical protein
MDPGGEGKRRDRMSMGPEKPDVGFDPSRSSEELVF